MELVKACRKAAAPVAIPTGGETAAAAPQWREIGRYALLMINPGTEVAIGGDPARGKRARWKGFVN